MMFRFKSTRQASRLARRLTAPLALLAGAAITSLAAAPAAATGLPEAGIVAAQPKGQIDCSKYAGTEKEACEKMMSRRRS